MDKPLVGHWWRFSKYEIRGGAIRPAQGAAIQAYRPWNDYEVAWDPDKPAQDARAKRKVSPPYESLLQLLESLRRTAAFDLEEEDERAILDWCSKHGLLGILPHKLQRLVFPARWGRAPGTQQVVPCVRVWTRTASGWLDETQPHHYTSAQASIPGRAELGALVPRDLQPQSVPPPGALVQSMGRMGTKVQSVGETLGMYFTDVLEWEREVHEYPMPLSEGFCRSYSEPLVDFVTAAVAFRNAVRELSKASKESTVDAKRRDVAAQTLNALAQPAHACLIPFDDGSVRYQWTCTSLLSSFALMAMQDLSQRRVFKCANCRKLFASYAYQASYCSATCRNTALKRRYRDSKKKKARAQKKRKGGSDARKKARTK